MCRKLSYLWGVEFTMDIFMSAKSINSTKQKEKNYEKYLQKNLKKLILCSVNI